ncbi:MAG TPA: hypothetical protein PK718_04845 [Candidatus Methanofastidiosa archaeon]|nr:hypothetical protein [Candidatus Methanofastidiosa archaeon]HPR41857.1 hypothetical protein [Candidatus Methanofastidiosa archaeon]
MDEKNRLGLLFTGIGGIAGVFSAFTTGKLPSMLILVIAIGFYYGASYITSIAGIDMIAYGGRRKILQSGIFGFIQGWLVIWFLLYEAANLY